MSGGFKLAFSYARRELRGGLKGFRVFIACLALGVATIAGVSSLSEAVIGGLQRDAKRLLGGDVSLRLIHRPATQEQQAYLKSAGSMSEIIEMRAMARTATGEGGNRSLVELKAVDTPYPLIGKFGVTEGGQLKEILKKADGAWGAVAGKGLLAKLKLKIGNTVQVGDARYRIMGTVASEPDRVASILSFGPRLLVSSASLPDTKLVQPGSQIRYRYRVALPGSANLTDWVEQLKDKFPTAGWRIRVVDEAAPGLRRFVERMTLFLSFVGLTTLLVGGVGVTNAVESYLDGRVRTIGMLKCLGASGGFIFRTYFIQILSLAIGGIILGLIAGAVAPLLAATALKGLLPIQIEAALYPLPLIIATLFGLLISVTFALWPLSRARAVTAASLFRDKVAQSDFKAGGRYLALVLLGVAALAALTIWSANDKWFASWFVAGVIVSLVLLRLSAALVRRVAANFTNLRSTTARLAIANLYRPGASTTSVMLSLGLGLSVLVAITLIEANLNRQVKERLPEMAPAFFFLDIQPDQVARFDQTVSGFDGTGEYRRVASLRGRIVKIAGKPVEEVDVASDVQWAVRGDRALTYAAKPAEDSKIVAGTWWPADYAGPPQISLDANLARGFGIGLGDTLTLNILGREIEATVGSLRSIDWRSLRFDFAIIFAPGTLEGAPHSHIAAIRAPENLEDGIEKAVTDGFRNVSVIRVREALQSAANILDGIGQAVRATSAVTIIGGVLVLAGAVAAGRRRRVYDAVVFKVLGATRGVILKAFLIEYGLLGVITGAVSAVIGSLTAWAVVVFLMRMDWAFDPRAVLTTVLVCLGVTLVVGFAGTWRALGQKAAPLLRNE